MRIGIVSQSYSPLRVDSISVNGRYLVIISMRHLVTRVYIIDEVDAISSGTAICVQQQQQLVKPRHKLFCLVYVLLFPLPYTIL